MGILERAIQKVQLEAKGQAAAEGRAQSATPQLPGRSQLPLPGRKLSINRRQLAASGIVPSRQHEAIVAEQFRGIKRPLIAAAMGKRRAELRFGNLLMVASALPGEGKTFCCFNLAVSIAQEPDSPVILVDADVMKPHLTEALGAEGRPGLLDLLADRTLTLADALFATDIDGLLFLGCGTPRPDVNELLASRRMETLAEELASSYGGMVVFDSPPLLLTNESQVLAGLVGQVLLVVAAGRTAQDKVQEAVEMIEEDKGLSLVLNRASARNAGYRYGSVARAQR